MYIVCKSVCFLGLPLQSKKAEKVVIIDKNRQMERIVIINESTFTMWMERVKEQLSILHRQEQRMKNKGLGAWLDTSEVCDMLNLSKRSVQSMRERGELPYTKIEGRIYHRTEDIAKMMEVMIKSK